MFTAQKADVFAAELSALLEKYIPVEDSLEERIVVDLVINNILADCSDAGFHVCHHMIESQRIDRVEMVQRVSSILEGQRELMRARRAGEELGRTLVNTAIASS